MEGRMMIPPVVRIGYPTTANHLDKFAILHREFGWLIVTKARAAGYFYREDGVERSPVHVTNILCWMPQDGS